MTKTACPTPFPQHLLSIDDLTVEHIQALLETTQSWLDSPESYRTGTLAMPQHAISANLFFENSTRTRCSFELAAHHLGIYPLNLDLRTSSTVKGESLMDTVDNLQSMGVHYFIMRHSENGAVAQAAKHLGNRAHVINAGDGSHEHPTQALQDIFTLYHYQKMPNPSLRMAILGDIRHSRVANSMIKALLKLGVRDIRLIAPTEFLPESSSHSAVSLHTECAEGLTDVDVVMVLRIQKERLASAFCLDEARYFKEYGLTVERLRHAKPDVLVMHPGPINRGIELESAVADGKHAVILQQVKFGVLVRMAVMQRLF